MSSVVVDASIVVAATTDSQRARIARAQLSEWISSSVTLYAPSVLFYEVANVLARYVFDELMTLSDVTDVWHDISTLGLRTQTLEPFVDGIGIARVTSQLRRRHATDSAYVWLAQRLETELWTLDGPLARNARDVGLPVRLLGNAPS